MISEKFNAQPLIPNIRGLRKLSTLEKLNVNVSVRRADNFFEMP